MRKYIVILLLTVSCSEEEMSPRCAASRDACEEHLKHMDHATTAKEKEQHWQLYLTEKHYLDNCLNGN